MSFLQARYYYGNDECAIEPENREKKDKDMALPDSWLIGKPGSYLYKNLFWPVYKEGFYSIIAEDGSVRRFCFYQKDAFALTAALLHCCEFSGGEFSGELGDVKIFLYLNSSLSTKNEKNMPAHNMGLAFLTGALLAVRHIGLYSAPAEKTVFNWLEVWNEQQSSWELYWPEKSLWLGYTSQERTCFDVFEELCQNTLVSKEIAPQREFFQNFEERELTKDAVEAMRRGEECAGFMKKWRVFPFISADGLLSAKASADEKYESYMQGKDYTVNKDSGVMNLRFFDDKYIKECIYGAQVYIIRKRLLKIGQ